jgi:hypothetical protein
MRALILAFVSGITMAGMSAQAAPLAPRPTPVELGAAPSVELIAGGCWWGHWGRCVPNGW